MILPEHLPFEVKKNMKDSSWGLVSENIEKTCLKEVLENVEIQLLSRAYQECKTTYDMAEYLGISQPTIIYKLKKYKDRLSC